MCRGNCAGNAGIVADGILGLLNEECRVCWDWRVRNAGIDMCGMLR